MAWLRGWLSSDPTRNRRAWDALSAEDRASTLHAQPELFGLRDGLPARVRHLANVQRIETERQRTTAERDDLARSLAALPARRDDGWRRYVDRIVQRRRIALEVSLWYANRRVEEIDRVEHILSYNQDALLLLLDCDGKRVLAAVAIGDPDTADHIGVTTPGLNANVLDTLDGMLGQSRKVKYVAENELKRLGHHDTSVSMIAWIGFPAPQTRGPTPFARIEGYASVARPTVARRAAPALADFLTGLSVASQNRFMRLTALGHSYGSLVAGLALQSMTRPVVDDLLVYGSPGINASTPAELGMRRGHVFVMEAPGDTIADIGRARPFGPDPSSGDFVQLSVAATTTPDGVERGGSQGHAEYPRQTSNGRLRTAGYNMAVIVAGLSELAVRV